MLSRAASSLYWLGRYVERAEFTSRLLEATLRLDAVTGHRSGQNPWGEALEILGLEEAFDKSAAPLNQASVARFLMLDTSHIGSIVQCLDAARDNARAVRTALSRDAWSAINRAWLLFRGTEKLDDTQAALDLVERAEIETRAFEGALGRMLLNQSSYFMRLGAAIERADSTARLLDAKWTNPPDLPQAVAHVAERDRWQSVLQTVSAVNAYRWLYSEGLRPSAVIELLVLRRELPRSIAASIEELTQILHMLSSFTGKRGEADRLARECKSMMAQLTIDQLMAGELPDLLTHLQELTGKLNAAIAQQFRFH
jgi:uncharacterized alpha-E superfamily protein